MFKAPKTILNHPSIENVVSGDIMSTDNGKAISGYVEDLELIL